LSKEEFLTFWLAIKIRPWVDVHEAPSPHQILDNVYGRSQLLHKIRLSELPFFNLKPEFRNKEISFIEVFGSNDIDRLAAELQALFMINELLENFLSELLDKIPFTDSIEVPDWLKSVAGLIQRTAFGTKLANWLVSLQTRISAATEQGFPTPQAPVYDNSHTIDEDETFLEFLWNKAIEVAEKVVEIIEEGVDVLQQFRDHVRSKIINVYRDFLVGTYNFFQGLWDGFVENVVEPSVVFVNNVVESTVKTFTDIIEKAVTGGVEGARKYQELIKLSLREGILAIPDNIGDEIFDDLDLTIVPTIIEPFAQNIKATLGPFDDILSLFDLPLSFLDDLPGIFKEILNYVGPNLYISILMTIMEEVLVAVVNNFMSNLPIDEFADLLDPLFEVILSQLDIFDELDLEFNESTEITGLSSMISSVGQLVKIISNKTISSVREIYNNIMIFLKSLISENNIIIDLFLDFASMFTGGILYLFNPNIIITESQAISFFQASDSNINTLSIFNFVQDVDGLILGAFAVVAGVVNFYISKRVENIKNVDYSSKEDIKRKIIEDLAKLIALSAKLSLTGLRALMAIKTHFLIREYGPDYDYIVIPILAIFWETFSSLIEITFKGFQFNTSSIDKSPYTLENRIQILKNLGTLLVTLFLSNSSLEKYPKFAGDWLALTELIIFQLALELIELLAIFIHKLDSFLNTFKQTKSGKFVIHGVSPLMEFLIYGVIFALNLGH
jgi:hypothetical protein